MKEGRCGGAGSGVLLGSAGAWMECYRYSKADWDITAGSELCGTAWGEDCSGEGAATGAEIEIYDFMDVPNFTYFMKNIVPLTTGRIGTFLTENLEKDLRN